MKKQLTIITIIIVVALSLIANVVQWDKYNQLEILKNEYAEMIGTQYVEDGSTNTTTPVYFPIYTQEVESKAPQMFKTIWTIQYNKLSLPEIGEIDLEIRQTHNGSCIIKVELEPINNSGYAVTAGADMLYWNNDQDSSGDNSTGVLWIENEGDSAKIGIED